MIYAGVDVGSISAKAAIYDAAEARVVGTSLQLTGWTPREAGNAALHAALDQARATVSDLGYVVATGYGRVSMPFADDTVTEISCHARGAHYLLPSTRTVVDIGGQDSKVISVGETGYPLEFAMNDRCAAGTGRFIQVMADALGLDVGELGVLGLRSQSPAVLSSVCTVFAESEVVGLIAAGIARRDIAAGLCEAVAKRVMGLVTQVGVTEDVLLSGGVSKCEGVVAALERAMGVTAQMPDEPQLVGAIGAAVIAAERSG